MYLKNMDKSWSSWTFQSLFLLVNTLFLLVKSPYFWAENMIIRSPIHPIRPSDRESKRARGPQGLRGDVCSSSCPWTSVSVYEHRNWTFSGVWYGMAIVMSIPHLLYTTCIRHVSTCAIIFGNHPQIDPSSVGAWPESGPKSFKLLSSGHSTTNITLTCHPWGSLKKNIEKPLAAAKEWANHVRHGTCDILFHYFCQQPIKAIRIIENERTQRMRE